MITRNWEGTRKPGGASRRVRALKAEDHPAVSAREDGLPEGVQIDDGRDADDKASDAAEQVEGEVRVDGVLGDAIDRA